MVYVKLRVHHVNFVDVREPCGRNFTICGALLTQLGLQSAQSTASVRTCIVPLRLVPFESHSLRGFAGEDRSKFMAHKLIRCRVLL